MYKNRSSAFNYDDYTEEKREKFCEIIDGAEPVIVPWGKPEVKSKYLISDLVDQNSFNLVYGNYHAGKSLVLVDLMASLAEDSHWAGREIVRCKTFYYAYENPDHINERVHVTYAVKFPSKTYSRNSCIDADPPDIFDPDFETALTFCHYLEHDFIEASKTHKVIIFDTLAYLVGDRGDENNFSTMGPIIKKFRSIVNLGYTVFVLTHPGKDPSKGPRGHSSLPAAADNIFFISSKSGSNLITMKQTKARNRPSGQCLSFEIKSGKKITNSGIMEAPYIEAILNGQNIEQASKKTDREAKVLKIAEELIETDPVNIRSVFGLQTDLLAIQLNQIEEVFIAKAIAPQAKSKASQRKAVKRVLDSLVQKEVVHERDGFYWLPDPDQTESDTAGQ